MNCTEFNEKMIDYLEEALDDAESMHLKSTLNL